MEKKSLFTLLSVGLIMVTLSISYYFLISLPNYNREKLNLEKERQAEDIRVAKDKAEIEQQKLESENNNKSLELAKEVQDDCIKNIKSSVVYYFDKTNTTKSPLFYPYEDEESFNKNERLLTALSAYKSCVTNDPRYDYSNSAIKSILTDAGIAETTINNYMFDYKSKANDLCNSFLLTVSAKSKCEDLERIKYDFGLQ